MIIKRFEDLDCRKKIRSLSKFVFALSGKDKFKLDFIHVKQINAAAGSSMDNIAEGFGRRRNKEFNYFLHVSLGSINEVKSQLYRAFDKQYISEEELTDGLRIADHAAGKVFSLIRTIENSNNRGQKFQSQK